MAMREKLIELIFVGQVLADSMCKKQAECNKCPYDTPNACRMGAMVDHIIANGVTIQQWIPASNPPKESGMYNVTVEKLYGITYSDVAYFDALSKKWGTNTHHYSCDKVTHWMPLPKPHKET